jgi:DNA-binding protein H-NS
LLKKEKEGEMDGLCKLMPTLNIKDFNCAAKRPQSVGSFPEWSIGVTEAHLMKSNKFECMSTDELWELHGTISSILSKRIEAEKAQLEERLRKLGSVSKKSRRPYPPVRPKYKNPNNPGEVWSGRGKTPRWVRDQLRTGKRLDQFLIAA